MNRIKLLLLSLAALFVGGLRDTFATANIAKPDPATGPLPGEEAPAPDSEVGLLIKGADVDWKDVTWRIRAGLTPKQAVEVAINEKREAAGQQANELSEVEKKTLAKGQPIGAAAPATGVTATATPAQLNKMTVPELKAHAATRNVDVSGAKTKAQLVTALSAAPAAPAAADLSEMTVAELKAEAAKRNVDISKAKTKPQLIAAINKSA